MKFLSVACKELWPRAPIFASAYSSRTVDSAEDAYSYCMSAAGCPVKTPPPAQTTPHCCMAKRLSHVVSFDFFQDPTSCTAYVKNIYVHTE